ncbi:hypothetical protein [Alloscardovia omnicolens]|uniref:hypothetical protein n=1 Tax=Alloscardovia omnicolens TaxID=419015 RepID=UPI003A6A6399
MIIGKFYFNGEVERKNLKEERRIKMKKTYKIINIFLSVVTALVMCISLAPRVYAYNLSANDRLILLVNRSIDTSANRIGISRDEIAQFVQENEKELFSENQYQGSSEQFINSIYETISSANNILKNNNKEIYPTGLIHEKSGNRSKRSNPNVKSEMFWWGV